MEHLPNIIGLGLYFGNGNNNHIEPEDPPYNVFNGYLHYFEAGHHNDHEFPVDPPPPYYAEDVNYLRPQAAAGGVGRLPGHLFNQADLLDLNPPPAPRLGYIALPPLDDQAMQVVDVVIDRPAAVAHSLYHTNPSAGMDMRCLADRLCWATHVATLHEPAFSAPTGPINLLAPIHGGIVVTIYPGVSGIVYVMDVLGALSHLLHQEVHASDGRTYSWLDYLPVGSRFNGLYDHNEALWELPPGSPTNLITYVVSATIPF